MGFLAAVLASAQGTLLPSGILSVTPRPHAQPMADGVPGSPPKRPPLTTEPGWLAAPPSPRLGCDGVALIFPASSGTRGSDVRLGTLVRLR